MSQVNPTPVTSCILPERPSPVRRVTMGSLQVPQAAGLAELGIHLPGEDGVPLETAWHRHAMNLLIEVLSYLWRDRDDFYVGGNQFIYYSVRRARNVDFVGPDFFFVAGVDRHRSREFWVVWDEGGRYPDLIVELLSESTADEDRNAKKTLYEQTFRTSEYLCYDPAANRLEGWQLAGQRYREIQPDERGWLWSEVVQLWAGTWDGEFQGRQATWPRFYDARGQLVPTGVEAERQRAEAERQKAEAERQRADTAEAELARLRAQLADLEKGGR